MKIQGIEENIYIELKLLNLKLEKSLFESFIPFELAINIREEKYEFKKDLYMTFTQYEVLTLIKKLKRSLINFFGYRNFIDIFFNSSESYFDLNILYGEAFDEIEVEIWLNLASLTNGKINGYNKGYRFVTDVEKIGKFTKALEKNYFLILKEHI